ncbi:MAG TPA: hypothetical protein PK634_14390, partial [Kiritimatiellia bacterium]|nr:hypothetical protein [Kiritimatiellia bacterium]
LPAPVPVEVRGEGVIELMVDGWRETLPYRGWYFQGTELSLGAISNQPLSFTVNGNLVTGGTWRAAVTGAMTLQASQIRPAE